MPEDTTQQKPTREAWCSWCSEFCTHTLYKESVVGRSTYQCNGCNYLTVQCRYCENMARAAIGDLKKLEQEETTQKNAQEEKKKKGAGVFKSVTAGVSNYFSENWHNELCAEHDGTIPDFEKSKSKINELSDFKELMTPKRKNYYGAFKQGTVVVGGVSVVATGAIMAAPGIAAALGTTGALGAASTGTAIGTLKGAALTSASLAKLGTGGLAIITATGAGLGGKTGYGLANAYMREIPDYQFLLKRSAAKDNQHRVIVVNGFLTENDLDAHDWCEGLNNHFLNSPVWYLNWESKTLKKLGAMLGNTSKSALARGIVSKGISSGSKVLAKNFGRGSTVLGAAGLVGNPWHSAMLNAEKSGALLAEAISRTEGKTFTLLGHSLGARVVFFALEALASKSQRYVRQAVLMGGAVGINDEEAWVEAAKATEIGIHNCYSENDAVLKFLYRGANIGMSTPAGLTPAVQGRPQIYNHDFSELIGGHNDWKPNLPTVIDRLKIME